MTGPHIQVQQLGFAYGSQVLFKGLNLDLPLGTQMAIIGRNGSGKSSLLRLLAGYSRPTQGSIVYSQNGRSLPAEEWYTQLSWTSPHAELPPLLTVEELFVWQARLVPPLQDCPTWLNALGLKPHSHKALKTLSSGLLQRVKVGLAVVASRPLLLLDEPTAFLDPESARMLLDWIALLLPGRTYLLASNEPDEYADIAQRLLL